METSPSSRCNARRELSAAGCGLSLSDEGLLFMTCAGTRDGPELRRLIDIERRSFASLRARSVVLHVAFADRFFPAGHLLEIELRAHAVLALGRALGLEHDLRQ